jgi:hemerythrin-like domain-containing protein
MELIGLLMREHRLIEQIIPILETELRHISQNQCIHLPFIHRVVDFFRTYVDKLHHGKEEDILFAKLSQKPLDARHQRILEELVDEHRLARRAIQQLVSSTEAWPTSEAMALQDATESLTTLVALYPQHIRKEDKEFFLPCQAYFTKAEREQLLATGIQFDQTVIHDIYRTSMNVLREHGNES